MDDGRPILVFTRWWQLAILALAALLIGVGGQASARMYLHHSEQHWNAEQFQAQQKALNDQLIAAINQLAAKVPK